MRLDLIKKAIKWITTKVSLYYVLWLIATHIVFKLYLAQIYVLDFRYWDSDLITVSSIGYFILSAKVYDLLTIKLK